MTPAEIRKAVLELKEGAAENRVRIEGLAARIDKLEHRAEKTEETLADYRERLAILDHHRGTLGTTDDSNRSLKRDLSVAVVNILLGAVVAYIVAKKS